MSNKIYDFIIIGGGGTGLAAGMYSARLGLKTLVLGFTHGTELPIGGVIQTTHVVENYLGIAKISGDEIAKKLYIIYRGEEIRPEPINYERIKKNKKIEIINHANIVEIKGKDFVKSVVLDRNFKGKKNLDVDGVFVAIGHIALSDLAKTLGVKTDEKNEIKINH